MKVLFLDVDGVLNCNGTRERCHSLLGVEQSKCELVRKIVRETDCRIVLSSTWRLYPAMHPYLWAELQLRDKWIGSTPRIDNAARGDEISKWIEENPECDSWVILDDDADMCEQTPHLVKTEFETGLTPSLADEVIDRLNA